MLDRYIIQVKEISENANLAKATQYLWENTAHSIEYYNLLFQNAMKGNLFDFLVTENKESLQRMIDALKECGIVCEASKEEYDEESVWRNW